MTTVASFSIDSLIVALSNLVVDGIEVSRILLVGPRRVYRELRPTVALTVHHVGSDNAAIRPENSACLRHAAEPALTPLECDLACLKVGNGISNMPEDGSERIA